MKTIKPLWNRVICENPDSPFGYFGWPSVIRLPDGALAMACSGLRLAHVCPFGKGVICYSRDEGEHWTAPAIALDTPLDDRDCGLTVFGGGRVILTSFNNTVAFQRDRNRRREENCDPSERALGSLVRAYLDAVEASGREREYLGSTYRISEDGGYTFGPVRRVPVTAPHGPLALRDGALLYVGRRFSRDDSPARDGLPHVEAWRSPDGENWERVGAIEDIWEDGERLLSCEPHALELPDGRILVHTRVQGGTTPTFTLYQSESTDGGRTFTRPRPLLPRQGGAPAHLLAHSGGALMSLYGYRQPPYGIRAMFSRDGGATWDADWVLYDGGQSGDLGYPATVECADGTLLTVYYENVGGRAVIKACRWALPE